MEAQTPATPGAPNLSRSRRGGGRCRVLRQPLFELLDVLEQPGAGETQEVKAERRILHVELFDLGVAYAQDDAAFDAFQRLSTQIRGRQHAEFADDSADR